MYIGIYQLGNVYRKFVDYKSFFVKNEINTVFVNPIKFRKILAAGGNGVTYYSINSISFSEISTEINKTFMQRYFYYNVIVHRLRFYLYI